MATTALPTTLVPAGTWDLDPSHTQVEFVARHLMVAKVRGRFPGVSGVITIGDDPIASSVHATIDAASIDTGDPARDEHLKSPDFLDVAQFPTLGFVSTGVRAARDGHYTLAGDLTIRGITRPVELDLEFEGSVDDPWGSTKAAFSASTEINRKDWGLEWNVVLEKGGVLVGERVRLHLEVEATLRKAA